MSVKGAIKINFTYLPYLSIWRPYISSRNSGTVAMAICPTWLQRSDLRVEDESALKIQRVNAQARFQIGI